MWPDRLTNPGPLTYVKCPMDCAMQPEVFINSAANQNVPYPTNLDLELSIHIHNESIQLQ